RRKKYLYSQLLLTSCILNMQVLALLGRCHSLRLHTPQLKKKKKNNNNNNNNNQCQTTSKKRNSHILIVIIVKDGIHNHASISILNLQTKNDEKTTRLR